MRLSEFQSSRFSQIASNPANGVNNIPLSGGEGEATGLSPEEAIALLKKVQNASPQDAVKFKLPVEDMLSRATQPQVQKRLQQIASALVMTQDPKRQTIDPATGEKDPTAAQLAETTIGEITQMQKSQSGQQSQNDPNGDGAQSSQNSSANSAALSAPAPQVNSALALASPFNFGAWRLAQARPAKKKKRGNPFRVLMGKIGKLLDKGVAKADILRFILKEDKWNEETINRAIDVVKDYNKKRRRKENDAPKSFDDKSETEEKTEDKKEKKTAASFNMARFASDSKIGEECVEGGDLLATAPVWEKRSTAELMARATWLHSLQNYNKSTPQGDFRNAADKTGVAAQIKSIRAALKARGFDDTELAPEEKK